MPTNEISAVVTFHISATFLLINMKETVGRFRRTLQWGDGFSVPAHMTLILLYSLQRKRWLGLAVLGQS